MLYSTRMARPFIQICIPIHNGISPCSPLTHQTHHLDHQHLLHTGKIFPRLLVPLYRYNSPLNRGVLHGSGYSDRVMRGQAKSLAAPTASHWECPKLARGIDMTLVQCAHPRHPRRDVVGAVNVLGFSPHHKVRVTRAVQHASV